MTKKIVSYGLILQIIIGSIGVTVFKHTCNLFGQTDTSLYHAEACCSDLADDITRIDVKCCSIDVADYKVDVLSSFLASDFEFTATIAPTWDMDFELNSSLESKTSIPFWANAPPPKQSQQVLLQTFLI